MYRRDCLDKIGCETCLIWLCADWAFPFFVFIVLSSLCCFSMVDALIYPASEPRPPVKDMNTSRNTAWPPPVISLCYHFGKRRNTVRIYYSCLHWPNENCVARKNTSFFDLFFFVQLWACAASLKLAYFFFFFFLHVHCLVIMKVKPGEAHCLRKALLWRPPPSLPLSSAHLMSLPELVTTCQWRVI